MSRFSINKSGIALLMVLVIILVVIALAQGVLSIILNQSRLTHHNVSRISAYYAAMAGINLAYEKLRTGDWAYSANYCINYSGNPPAFAPAEDIVDPAIPYEVKITIGNQFPGGAGPSGTTPISVTTNYTPQP